MAHDIAAVARRHFPQWVPMYKIRIVDASDDDVVDTLADLHRLTFFDAAAMPQFELERGGWPITAMMRSLLPASSVDACSKRRLLLQGRRAADGIGGGDFSAD